jgi:hypothetical protein
MTSLAFLIDTDWVVDHFNAVSYATHRLKTPAGFKISEISQGRLTCYVDEFRTAYALIADHREPQNQLLSLSRNSKEMTAYHGGYFVIIDRPDVVIDARSQVARAARSWRSLARAFCL